MTLQKWIKTPKGYVAVVLFAYLLIASIGYKSIMGIGDAFVAVLAAVIVDIICNNFKNKYSSIPDGAVITGLIISLILSSATSIVAIAGTSAIAILSKHLLTYKKRPIFNPAAFGLLFSVLLFQTGQSWWGAFGDLSVGTIVFLLAGGFIMTNRINKFPQVFAYLFTTFTLLAIMGFFHIGDAVDALRPPFINATLFFGFFMLTDPPTSPAKDRDQVLFGILTAATGTIIYGIFGGLMYLFIGLCIGNFYVFQKKRSTSRISMNRSNAHRALSK
jgi:Na+-translocating ferredoxin:NAD+ oxidoreductase RnfD subunit